MEKLKSDNLIAILLLIISIIMGFFVNPLPGFLFGIASIVICFINLKSEDIRTRIIFICSLILTIYFMILLILGLISIKAINDAEKNMINTFKLRTYEACEDDSANQIKTNIMIDKTTGFVKLDNKKYIASISSLGSSCAEECNGYVIADINTNTYKTYLSCKDYKTDGFDKKMLNLVK